MTNRLHSVATPRERGVAWLLLAWCAALLLAWLGAAGPARAADDFLEPERAFPLAVRAVDDRTIEVQFDVVKGYYLYREQFRFAAEGAQLGTPQIPKGVVKYDKNFEKDVETHRGEVRIAIPVTQAAGPFKLVVTSQGCADAGLCYPPMTRTASVSLRGFGGDGSARVDGVSDAPRASTPAAGLSAALSDDSAVASVLRSGRFWSTVGAFLVMGLLLAFTPCVLPMLPILSSIIVGSGQRTPTRSRGLMLAGSYSLGMALVYTLFGIAAGLAGEGLAAWLQAPWVLALFAAALITLALSMFDVYELQMPAGLLKRFGAASQRLRGGRAAGVFAMGGLSALIVSPCVTAPLAGALLYLSQTRDVVLGGSALFALAAGMSVPLLLLGASAGTLLPKGGAWMQQVKRFFGVLLIGVAIWIVQPVLPASLMLAAWGALLVLAGFMLRPFDRHPHAGSPRVWLQRTAGVAAMALGLMQFVGAASGGRDPLQPLAHLAGGGAASPSLAAPAFRPVRSVAELDALLRTTDRIVMLDFYADWCVSCKEMERFTFTDPEVARRMGGALLLKADVTANNADDRELLKRFKLFGPPGTIFFDRSGRELDGLRVIGFQNAERFNQTLRSVGL